jgi:uncharacterized phage protein gp47/JayE
VPNLIDANGVTVRTRDELLQLYQERFKAIYGPQVDISTNSPDGQMIAILVQDSLDMQDFLVNMVNSFNPDAAIGVLLDQRVAINGIQRQAGTFTITPISVTVSTALTLVGLDQDATNPYTVSDNVGNKWLLQTTQNIVGAGTFSFNFRAQNPGQVTTIPNTITVPVTVVIGVTAVNNPTTYSTLGQNEESDATLRIRRQEAVQMPSQGFQVGSQAALGNVPNVTYAKVYENKKDITDADGIPPHCMWAVVGGTGAPAAIANAVYVERTEGCNMRGAQTYNIVQADGTLFTVQWDNVEPETLYIQFVAESIDGINPPKLAQILADLPGVFTPGIGEEVNVTALGTAIQKIDPNCLVSNAGFAFAALGPYFPTLTPSAKNKQFTISSQNIYITPMVMLPNPVTVPANTSQQFNAYGGTQTGYTYSMDSNPSGGTINPVTGLYTAGPTPATDVVKVVDSNANTAFATVTVV